MATPPKLYYTPHTCGASNFIAAFAAGLKIDCEKVKDNEYYLFLLLLFNIVAIFL